MVFFFVLEGEGEERGADEVIEFRAFSQNPGFSSLKNQT
jgi:hypothetical protein